MNILKLLMIMLLLTLSMNYSAWAKPSIAVLDFELKDVTLLPNNADTIARTAALQESLSKELRYAGFTIVPINANNQQIANAGEGYLFDHADSSAELGKQVAADYVLVGRLHKPSFLFIYLMAHLVEVNTGRLVDSYSIESKGGDKKLIGKAVETLAEKISQRLSHAP